MFKCNFVFKTFLDDSDEESPISMTSRNVKSASSHRSSFQGSQTVFSCKFFIGTLNGPFHPPYFAIFF